MAKVRVLEAATEGFRLIGREPKAVLAWSGVLFLLLGLPMMLYMNRFSAAFLQLSGDPTEEEAVSAVFSILAMIPILMLVTIAGYTVVGGAIVRAVISPEDRPRFYLRLSKAELWMALSAVVGAVVGYIASFVLFIVVGIVVAIPAAFLAAAATGAAAAGPGSMSSVHWAIVLSVLLVEIGIGYVMLRFSMAPLMSFDERRFRLFESWSFTRGSGWRLFGLLMVLGLAMVVFELLVMAVMFGGLGPWVVAMAGDPVAMQQFMVQVGSLYTSPWMLLWIVLGTLLGGAMMSLLIAPFARAYLMLREAAPLAALEAVSADAV